MGPLTAGRLVRAAGQRVGARAAQRAGAMRGLSTAAAPKLLDVEEDNIVRSTRRVAIPNDVTLTHFVLSGIVGRGAREALVDAATGQALTYGELEGRIATVAAGLAARGVRRGDVVAVVLPNTPFYPVLFHAIASLGAVVSSANPAYTHGELAHQLRDSASKLVITAAAMLPAVAEAAGAAGLPRGAVLTLGTPEAAFLTGPPDPAAVLPPVPRGFVASRELVAMPYSSGTTGLPKGVELTHGNLISNVLQTMADPVVNCGMVPDKGSTEVHTSLGVLPFFHIYGATLSLHSGLYVGTRLICMNKFDPVAFLEALVKYRVNFAPLVPPIIQFLARHPLPLKYDLSSIKVIFSGAAPLDAETQAAVQARLPGCSVRQGYGLTEASPVSHMPAVDDILPGSIGRLVANMEAAVQAPDGRMQPPGKKNQGELLLRGPNVMRGYHNAPEANAVTLTPDGWLHTGDVAWRDERGNFFITDRMKELIKVKGSQVAPAELEGLLLGHPAVADAAVVPRKDDRAGEVPVAFVVLRQSPGSPPAPPGTPPPAGSPALAEEIRAYIAGKVVPYKHLAEVRFTGAIPKSASGKILRRLLRDALNAETAAAAAAAAAKPAA